MLKLLNFFTQVLSHSMLLKFQIEMIRKYGVNYKPLSHRKAFET